MSTLRKQLTNAGFDWAEPGARIVMADKYQDYDDTKPIVTEEFSNYDVAETSNIALDDPRLDEVFNAGFGGGKEGRHLIAEDSTCIYFPVCYDGSEWFGKVYKDLDTYLAHPNKLISHGGE